MDQHTNNKLSLAPLRAAQYDFDPQTVQKHLTELSTQATRFRMCFPFNDLTGPKAFYDACYAPLFEALPNLERRDWIVMAGPDEDGLDWVGCGGHYVGTFVKPWLGIPPTGHLVHMRFHEFYRFEAGKVVEFQAIWDIPEVMMQAGVWPMSPSLGLEFCVPGPATCDGLVQGPYDPETSNSSRDHVLEMLTALKRYPQEPEEAMELDKYWHERMNWYGPACTGTCRGVRGFRNWHQIPFVAGMPDRGNYPEKIGWHLFGDGDYVGVTGWPDMHQTLSHDGWLGIPPMDKKIDMRSLDFWRMETRKDGSRRIRENWVLWDMLDVYDQLGVDVFARMAERARPFERTVPNEVWKPK